MAQRRELGGEVGQDVGEEKRPQTPLPPAGGAGGGPVRTKLSYKDQRDYELLPARIEELEAAVAKGETLLSDPELYTRDPKRFAAISDGIANARAEKEAAEERWLTLAELVESA